MSEMKRLKLMKPLSDLTKLIYKTSDCFPSDEKYNTVSQMKRAMVSVRLNVREGNAFYDKRKITHFERALGSLREVDECMLIAFEFDWININEYEGYKELYWEVHNMLKKLKDSVVSKFQEVSAQ